MSVSQKVISERSRSLRSLTITSKPPLIESLMARSFGNPPALALLLKRAARTETAIESFIIKKRYSEEIMSSNMQAKLADLFGIFTG